MTWRTFPSIPEPVLWGAIQLPEKTDRLPPERADELPDAPWVIERRSAIWSASLLALLPPAFVLALGSALVWAFRGFRP